MSIAHATDIVSVWTDRGRPTRIIWRGTRYVVTDQSTPLLEDVWHDALTHPGGRIFGWRFQGSSVVDADVRMFDIRQLGDGRWELLHTYA